MKLSLLAWSAVIAAGAAIAADAPDTAGGTFKSKAVTLEIRSAIAFKAKSSLGSDDALIVAVTNATMHADAGKLVGEALLMKEKDAWHVDDELMELDSR